MSAKYEEGSLIDDRQCLSPATGGLLPAEHEAVAPASKRWISGPFVRLLATNMAIGFSLSCFYLLPKHLTVAYAASPGQVGAVFGIFGLASVLVVPWLGRAVSALGLPRTLVLAQLILAACAFAFTQLTSVGLSMLLVRTLQGLATAFALTAGVAMTCELAPAHKLGQAMGLAGAASLIMNAIAPAVGESIGARFGFAWVYALAGVAALLGAVAARRLPKAAPIPAATASVPISRHAIAVLVLLAVTSAGFYVVMTFLAPLALSRGMAAVKSFFVAYTVAALCVRILGAPLTERLGLRKTAVMGLLGYGAMVAGIAAVGPRSLVALGLGFGVAHGALFPALMALLFEDAPAHDRARRSALSNGVLNLGMLSVLGLGQLANHAGMVAVFLFAGVMVSASSLVLVREHLKLPSAVRRLLVAGNEE